MCHELEQRSAHLSNSSPPYGDHVLLQTSILSVSNAQCFGHAFYRKSEAHLVARHRANPHVSRNSSPDWQYQAVAYACELDVNALDTPDLFNNQIKSTN